MDRNTTIDAAKGIGILFVMGLHCGFHQSWMASFEMPLFFLLSGVFFKFNISFVDFLVKKINTLLIPYLFFEAPKIIYDLYFSFSHGISPYQSYLLSSFPSTTWFILSLFQIQIACYFLFHTVTGKYRLSAVACLASLTGYYLWVGRIPNYFFLASSITGSGYFIFGFLIRHLILRINRNSYRWALLIAAGMFSSCFIIWNLHKGNIFYRDNVLEDIWPAVIGMAITGALATIFLAAFLVDDKN